jgi:hypothetical protein
MAMRNDKRYGLLFAFQAMGTTVLFPKDASGPHSGTGSPDPINRVGQACLALVPG